MDLTPEQRQLLRKKRSDTWYQHGASLVHHGFDEIPGIEEDLLAFEAHMPTHAYEQLIDGFNDALEHKLDHPHDDSHYRNISKNKQGGVIIRRLTHESLVRHKRFM